MKQEQNKPLIKVRIKLRVPWVTKIEQDLERRLEKSILKNER